MTLTKEENNTHKQRTLSNDERPFKGSNLYETHINGWHSSLIRMADTASSDRDSLNGRPSLVNVRCLCVLFFSFDNVISFSCVKRFSFVMRWPMRHSCDRAFKACSHEGRIVRHRPTHEKRMTFKFNVLDDGVRGT